MACEHRCCHALASPLFSKMYILLRLRTFRSQPRPCAVVPLPVPFPPRSHEVLVVEEMAATAADAAATPPPTPPPTPRPRLLGCASLIYEMPLGQTPAQPSRLATPLACVVAKAAAPRQPRTSWGSIV